MAPACSLRGPHRHFYAPHGAAEAQRGKATGLRPHSGWYPDLSPALHQWETPSTHRIVVPANKELVRGKVTHRLHREGHKRLLPGHTEAQSPGGVDAQETHTPAVFSPHRALDPQRPGGQAASILLARLSLQEEPSCPNPGPWLLSSSRQLSRIPPPPASPTPQWPACWTARTSARLRSLVIHTTARGVF